MRLTIVNEPLGNKSFAVVADGGEKLKPVPSISGREGYYHHYSWNLYDSVLFLCPFICRAEYLDCVLEDCNMFFPDIDFTADAAELTLQLL